MRIISILFVGLSFTANSQDSNSVKLATIYFMRSTGSTGIGPFSTFIDDSLACYLNNNSYSIHQVKPGLHRLQTRMDGHRPRKKIKTLDITMAPGQTYYISLDVTNHYLTGSLYLMEVTVNTAKKMLPSLKEDKNCK
jgi:hypothetical protein